MKLIADSGSTKTEWVLIGGAAPDGISSVDGKPIATQGLNPFHQSEEQILSVLHSELLPRITECTAVGSVYFYGSGVRPEMVPKMAALLREAFPDADRVEAHSDLLGAARAICGRKVGIASILGTGANACLYDGRQIVGGTPSLGYIIGDEGSGAVLGKRFLHDLYGGLLSEEIKQSFERETGLSLPQVIERVYRQPLANRFLASLSPFIHAHLDDPGVAALVRRNFVDFLRLRILPLGRPDLSVGFVGSVAYYYEVPLREAAIELGISVGRILKSPIEGLAEYHAS